MATATVNGVDLYYELHGEGNDLLVLNNGVIASTGTWSYQLPALMPHLRVLLYDMRGQGQSGNEIDHPTCVIVGEQDRLKPPHYSRTIAERIPSSELHLLAGAGHAFFWEAAAAFNTVLLGFLLKS